MNWEKPMQAIKIALMVLTMVYGFYWSQKVLQALAN